MINSKNFIFSNFQNDINNFKITKNELLIDSSYNILTSNKKIEAIEPVKNYLYELYKSQTELQFVETNKSFFKTVKKFYKYDYWDDNSQSYKTRFFVLTSSKQLYEIYSSLTISQSLHTFLDEPIQYFRDNKFYLFSLQDKIYFYKDSSIIIANIPNIYCISNNNKKTYFCTSAEKYKIYYTELCDIESIYENLEYYESLEIGLNYGEILKIFNIKNKLYIITTFSILRMEDDGDIYEICTLESRIIYDTIDKINDYLIFCTESGLFIFDGNDIKQCFKNITNIFNGSPLKALTYNSKYLCLAKATINSIEQNYLFEIDTFDKSFCIYKIDDISDIYLSKSVISYDLLIQTNKQSSFDTHKFKCVNGTSCIKYVKFNDIIFDTTKSKQINLIKFDGSGKFYVKVKSESNNFTYEVTAPYEMTNLTIHGRIFSIEVYSNELFCINSIFISTQTIED